MTHAIRVIPAAVALLLAGFATDALAQTGAARCAGTAQFVRAQSSGVRTTKVNFNTDAMGNASSIGFFDPKPLITTSIATTGESTCLVVHFSALAEPQDNHVMFQVRVNGKPMQGHAIFPYSNPTVQAPVVWDPEETDQNLTRMVAYSFFAAIGPGTHTIDVRFAGCCGLTFNRTVIAVVRNAVLTLQY
jgi:hypothetical protein